MDLNHVDDWLNQFEFPDRYLAEYLVGKIRYVSFEEFEEWLQVELNKLIQEINSNGRNEPIAIFPVEKPVIHKFNENKTPKPSNDSSGRLGHSIKNLERRLPKHVELTPRPESMKSRKVKHIIYVDDFIGTGDRFIKSWKKTVSKSVKSWCTRGWCKIWILTFAGHQSGLSNVVNQIGPINKEQISVGVRVEKSFISENKNLLYLIEKYGGEYGYGETLSPIIFQHGCPNNVPNILWASRKCQGKAKWKPLFPNRSVPEYLYPLFSMDLTLCTSAEDIWISGNYALAIEFVDRLDSYRGNHQLLVILAFLNKSKNISKIRNVMVLSDEEFESILNELIEFGLINSEKKITRFGKEILLRSQKKKKNVAKKYEDKGNFYPASFMGFQREV